MFKRVLILALMLAITASGLYAQSAKLKRAKKFMEDLNYIGAIEVYQQLLDNQENSEAAINIAECYRKISDAENAEFWYGTVVRLPEAEAIHKLYYGQALQRNGKCDMAKEWYAQYVIEVPDDMRGQYLEKACDYEEELMTKNAGVFEIKHLDFNSNLDDFGPAYYGEGLVFASERDKGSVVSRTHSWTGNPFLELYKIEAKETGSSDVEGVCGEFSYGRAEKFNAKLNTKYHDAAVSFNSDQSTIFYTRNNLSGKDDEGTIRLKVFYAYKEGDAWSKEEGLPFNSDEYSVAHPTLAPDGERLFFASDMPGGYGGMDLYMSTMDNGRWGPPINLGPQINTEGNEVFPYYDPNNRLYFASDGLVGLGGLDIYYMDDKGDGEWGMIENLGYPMNTMSDDFGIIFNEEGTCGYFSSDRDGGAGRDDIYSFKKVAVPIEVFVYDKKTGEPIEGAMVLDECTGLNMETATDGKVIVEMKLNECCNFVANKERYDDNNAEGCTTGDLSERLVVEIPLSKSIVYSIEGIVFNAVTKIPLEGATVSLTNECNDEIQEILTDSDGRYVFELAEDCCYIVSGTLEGYSKDASDPQCTQDLAPDVMNLTADLNLTPTLATNLGGIPGGNGIDGADSDVYMEDNLFYHKGTRDLVNGTIDGITYVDGVPTESAGFPIGGSIEYVEEGGAIPYLLHIYYDFNQSYLRDEAENELDKLYNLLIANTDYIVEIGSHTDSRGSDKYNNRLSQRRAESVVRWLVDAGIEQDRLVARGYGESRNVNRCANKIPCSEQEHQMNRRTEFRVLGCRNCVDDDVRLSQPKDNPRVDPCQACPF